MTSLDFEGWVHDIACDVHGGNSYMAVATLANAILIASEDPDIVEQARAIVEERLYD